MTVSYTGDVANAGNFGIFLKIVCKWKGSVYKLVYKELLAYTLSYLLINVTYRMVIVQNSEACDETLQSCQRKVVISQRRKCRNKRSVLGGSGDGRCLSRSDFTAV